MQRSAEDVYSHHFVDLRQQKRSEAGCGAAVTSDNSAALCLLKIINTEVCPGGLKDDRSIGLTLRSKQTPCDAQRKAAGEDQVHLRAAEGTLGSHFVYS